MKDRTVPSFNIEEAAARFGVTAKMVRHYESFGLLPTLRRNKSGYRQYTERQVDTPLFIKRARNLGGSESCQFIGEAQ